MTTRTPPRRRTASETQDQIALFDLLRRAEPRYPLLGFVAHIPNGEKRDKATAARLKAMGVRSGIPDVLVFVRHYNPVLNTEYTGLAVELKTEHGRTSDNQDRWLDHLRGAGWYCEVCRDWTRAAALILGWVGADPKEYGL